MFSVSFETRRGQRSTNEDTAFVAVSSLGTEAVLAVADGMGGSACGEIASGIAKDEMEVFWAKISRVQSTQDLDIRHEIEQLFCRIDRRIGSYIEENPRADGMGTTLVFAFLSDKTLHLAHIGDSRAYAILGDNSCKALTEDHSLVAEAIRDGRMSPEEAKSSPYRHALSRVLDGSGDCVPEYQFYGNWEAAWSLLLSSDGYHGVITESNTSNLFERFIGSPQLTGQLSETALEAGSKDNVTVACCRQTESMYKYDVDADNSIATTWSHKQGQEDRVSGTFSHMSSKTMLALLVTGILGVVLFTGRERIPKYAKSVWSGSDSTTVSADSFPTSTDSVRFSTIPLAEPSDEPLPDSTVQILLRRKINERLQSMGRENTGLIGEPRSTHRVISVDDSTKAMLMAGIDTVEPDSSSDPTSNLRKR